jgi:rare lipoprotein A
VHRSTRVVSAIALIYPFWIVAAGVSAAQSLTDALAGPATNAAASGSWEPVIAVDPPKTKAVFDHWQAKVTVRKPSLKFIKPAEAAIAPAARPYALHGPILDDAHAMRGLASFYGKGSHTATGEAFNPRDLTAAHKTLPFGTRVRVTRVDNGDSVIVRINDRGPFKPGRVIDLSERAAEDLRITDKGIAAVKLEVVDRGPPPVAENLAQRSLRR